MFSFLALQKLKLYQLNAIYTLLLAATCILMLGYNIINILIVPNVSKQSDEVKYRLPLLMSLKSVRDNSSPYFASDLNDVSDFQNYFCMASWGSEYVNEVLDVLICIIN